jgi:hypothetical protein
VVVVYSAGKRGVHEQLHSPTHIARLYFEIIHKNRIKWGIQLEG